MSRLNLQASQRREPSVHTEAIKVIFLFLQHKKNYLLSSSTLPASVLLRKKVLRMQVSIFSPGVILRLSNTYSEQRECEDTTISLFCARL